MILVKKNDFLYLWNLILKKDKKFKTGLISSIITLIEQELFIACTFSYISNKLSIHLLLFPVLYNLLIQCFLKVFLWETLSELRIPTGSHELFINRSLCSYYKALWSECKKLHNLGKIHSFFISGDTVKMKINERSAPLSVTHVDDFGNYFPDADLSRPPR